MCNSNYANKQNKQQQQKQQKIDDFIQGLKRTNKLILLMKILSNKALHGK